MINNNTDVALEFLRRSKAALFTLNFIKDDPPEFSDDAIYDALDTILTEIHRLQRIQIVSDYDPHSRFWDLLNRSAPSIESVSINIWNQDNSAIILPAIFHNDMPKLKSVCLLYVDYWPHNNFRNLVQLHLFRQARNCLPDLVTFLQMLNANSVTLEDLILNDAGPKNYTVRPGVEHYAPCISLPALRNIEISGMDEQNGVYLKLFLSHIIIPPMTRCHFVVERQKLTPSQYFPRRGEKQHLPIIRKLVLTASSSACIFGRTESTFYANVPRDQPNFILQDIELLKDVEELVYIPGQTWSAPFEWTLLGALPSLRTFKVKGHFSVKLFRIWDTLQECDYGTSMRCAPKLENLHVYCEDPWSSIGASKQMNALIDTIEVRRRHECPLKRVIVDGFPKSEADRLKHFTTLDSNGGEKTGMTTHEIIRNYWKR
jgi:hypothetical protein